ncbi:MAG: polysaccharide deacetylase family protein [Syntrophomonas sp.]
MRTVFLPRRGLLAALALLVLLVGIAGYYQLRPKPAEPAAISNQPIYQGNSGQKAVAITINVDWGEEYIPVMLEEMNKAGAKATFFVTGSWAQKNPEVLQNIFAQGHSIQNHGYKHLHFAALSPVQVAAEIKKAEEVVYDIIGQRTSFFASPYGEQNRQIMQGVSSIDYDLVMWTVDTIDWQRPSPDVIVKRVMNKVQNDSIILMHPTEPTVKALPTLIQRLQEEGFQILPIEQIVVKKPNEAPN